MRSGHAREVPGRLRAIVVHPLGRVEVLTSTMTLCLVVGREVCSATTLIASAGGWV